MQGESRHAEMGRIKAVAEKQRRRDAIKLALNAVLLLSGQV